MLFLTLVYLFHYDKVPRPPGAPLSLLPVPYHDKAGGLSKGLVTTSRRKLTH